MIAHVAALTLAVLTLTATDARAARRVTITRAAIEASGAVRLADVFSLAESWAPQTNDFYTWSPTPRALSLPRAPGWTLFLDGQHLDVSVFDAIHAELVPVTLAEIDSVVFSDAAPVDAAWESARGRVEVFTSRPRRGWDGGGATSVGTETGDTGLASSASVVGPDAAAWVTHAGPDWYASISAALAEHPYTDPAMSTRTRDALKDYRPGATGPAAAGASSWFYDPNWPSVLRTSASLRAGVRADRQWHRVILSIMNARRYFHYSEPFGRELPTDQAVSIGGVSGTFDVSESTRLGYRARVSENALSDQDGVLAFDYDWAWRRAGGGVDVDYRRDRTRVDGFASVEDRRARTGWALTRDRDTFVRAGASAERRAGRTWLLGAEATGTWADGSTGVNAAASVNWVVRPADTLRARIAVSERLFVEDDNLWLWYGRGYGLPDAEGVSVTMDGPISDTRVYSADVGWASRGVLGGVAVDAGLRRFDDAYVEQRDFTFDTETCAFESPTRIVTGETGHVGILRARLWHALGTHSRGDFSYTYHEEFDSDAAFGALWQTIPRNRLSYAISARPGPSWGFGARVTHLSSTTWNDYAGVDGVRCRVNDVVVTYNSRVDGFTFVDANIHYGWWRRRAVVDLIVRNLFDADVRYHPVGATLDLAVYAQLRVRWAAP